MSNPRSQWFPVADPESLASLIRGAIRERFDGSIRRAAFHASGVEWPETELDAVDERAVEAARRILSRLTQAERPQARIRLETLAVLEAVVGPERRGTIRELVLPNDAMDSLNAYDRWLDKRLSPTTLEIPMDVVGPELSRATSEVLLDTVGKELWKRFPGLIESFEKFMVEKGHLPHRRRLAMYRIAEPWLDHVLSGAVERSLEEMNARELRRYVRLSIEREKLLLNRTPDAERANEAKELVGHAHGTWFRASETFVDPRSWAMRRDREDPGGG